MEKHNLTPIEFLSSPDYKDLAATWLYWKIYTYAGDLDIKLTALYMHYALTYFAYESAKKQYPYLIDMVNKCQAWLSNFHLQAI